MKKGYRHLWSLPRWAIALAPDDIAPLCRARAASSTRSASPIAAAAQVSATIANCPLAANRFQRRPARRVMLGEGGPLRRAPSSRW
jgi:hypothetical protein